MNATHNALRLNERQSIMSARNARTNAATTDLNAEDYCTMILDAIDANDLASLLVVGVKVRTRPHNAKFFPIVEFIGVAMVDDVKCLVGHDVEYKKTRITPVDSLASIEVKNSRYVVAPLTLLDAVTLDAITTKVAEVEVVAEVTA